MNIQVGLTWRALVSLCLFKCCFAVPTLQRLLLWKKMFANTNSVLRHSHEDMTDTYTFGIIIRVT